MKDENGSDAVEEFIEFKAKMLQFFVDDHSEHK